ncbi:hypothetical protein HS088_TW03G00605 [Tripterygium wilfordii]|uniref:Uncharacterized protein n=1 Tax=Tripterygium wilfordii TaxID=458696 RepID=A0A7J7DVD9_TRIWF|nr:hypothetical protein HS088_TW03G00605 [Tripterygium wilfordii]
MKFPLQVVGKEQKAIKFFLFERGLLFSSSLNRMERAFPHRFLEVNHFLLYAGVNRVRPIKAEASGRKQRIRERLRKL